MSYISSQLTTKEEMKQAEKVFRDLDINNDGKPSQVGLDGQKGGQTPGGY